jgi:hypothetical protein
MISTAKTMSLNALATNQPSIRWDWNPVIWLIDSQQYLGFIPVYEARRLEGTGDKYYSM